jgi:ElaA protein
MTAHDDIGWSWLRFESLGVHGVYDALALRSRVFVLEQGPYLDADGKDASCWHLLGRDGHGVLHAYLRVVDPGLKYAEPSMGRVVVSPERRGQGLGRVLVGEGVRRADAAWPGLGNRISAQAHLESFYAGFGFARVGEPYGEDDIPHIQMFRAGTT